ncbi:MAG: hypothetical protein HXS46_13205 [Theionarchaea archaeon]|nr:hypothetical protein [Theionarchaea archaeon]
MIENRRTLIVLVVLLVIIGIGISIRSYYIRTDVKYLLGFDPYYHYRMADTIVEQGSRPQWDTLAAHPTGAPVKHPPLFHYYLAYTYLLINPFTDMTLFQWCIYANTIPIILAVIAAFFAGKMLTNDIGGLFAALFLAVNGAISSRTVIGYTDTDIWIILFSLVATWFFFAALKSEKKYVWSSLLGFSLFLFALTWTGHWHLPLLVFSVFVIYFLMGAVKKEFDSALFSVFVLSFLWFTLPWTLYNGYYATGGVLALLGILWVLQEKVPANLKRVGIPLIGVLIIGITVKVFVDEGVFSTALTSVKQLLGVGVTSPTGDVILPDISISIIQRLEVTLSALSALFSLLLVVAPFGIVFLLVKRDKFSLQALVYVVLYVLGTGLLMLMGGRYTMLFAIPLLLAGGIFFGLLPEILKTKAEVTPRGVYAAVAICALSVVPCYIEGAQVSRSTPGLTDDLWDMLTWIDQSLPEDAVIISGWDTGYWIESLAQRKSVMNGAHYDIGWRVVKYGKLMETTDELTAMKEVYGFSDESEVRALRAFPENDEGAVEKEMSGFAEDNAYVLVSEWTTLTFYWISYFGNWDYTTGEGVGRLYNPLWAQGARKLISATEYTYGDQNIVVPVIRADNRFHSYIRGEEEYIPTMGTLFFKDGQIYFLKRDQGQLGVIYVPPKDIPYFETKKKWPDMPSEVFIIAEKNLDCMLTRLYFFNGEGLHYFELVKDCGTAKLYKVHKVPQEFDQGIITEKDTYVQV